MNYCSRYFEEMENAARSIDFSELKGKSLLITGGRGLILSSLVDILCWANLNLDTDITIYLAARTEKSISERFSAFYGQPWLKYVYYDALKPVDFDFKADYLIHGASNAHPTAYLHEPVETLLANVLGIKELLDYARKSGTLRVLYISSSEVYGRKNSTEPFKEKDYGFVDILNSRACYPSGKRAAETLCAAYTQEYGLDTVIVRPGHIYGPTFTPSDSRATAQFMRNVLAGNDIVMKSSGTQLRSYCYSADCATAILTVMLKGKVCEAYNISNRDSVISIRQIAEKIAEVSGKKVIFEKPSDAEQSSYNMMDNSSLDAEKLEALGWKAFYKCENGVKQMYEIMKG
ncbi:MAG: NAD-dependent epimerase/dehydratase family protein [Ruminococcus sp.]|nr:NAD-dependent epimerase/dehydratase family protein [Ruminococcus sp.]MDE6848095.1 NAD-dependent epimerase/dehydratase family protein [Ruminococcus sp.]MDE7137547.1 NAD-dependent epimerase/dehydratase family protein [Ruminococcus sp.]